jgi:hypothetical protein
MSTSGLHSTVVRLLYSGRVLRDSMRCAEMVAIVARHELLVRHMADLIGGRPVEAKSAGRVTSTIYVGDKALIEVVST